MAIMSVALPSCIADEDLVLEEGSPEDPVLIGANVLPSEKTRGYIEEGQINSGEWYMVYKRTANYYNHALVSFGNIEGPTTGYPFFTESGVPKELKWKYVYGQGGSLQPFYLTNLSPDRYTTQSSDYLTHFRFNTGTNPFVASPLDKAGGENDILIGGVNARASDKKFEVPLYHALSLLKVNVEVYGSSDRYFVDLSEAEVTITDLCRTVESVQLDYRTTFRYNESKTTTDSEKGGTYSNPGPVTLVDRAEGNQGGPGWNGDGPKDVPIDDRGNVKKVYTTQEFVMPPQSIPPSPLPSTATTEYTGKHPVLKIRVKKSTVTGQEDMEGYVTYSGVIPDIMFTLDEDGNMLPTPERIALKSGAQLNITATINSPETDLMFAPVTVEPWVGTDNFTLNTKQAGIYNESQFWRMVEAYKKNDMYTLERFGYWDGDVTQNGGRGTFVFQLWATIPLNKDEIQECLRPRQLQPGDNPTEVVPSSFCFIFNGFSVAFAEDLDHVNDDTESLEGSAGAIEFYNMVTGGNEEYIGIRTTEDLSTVMSMFSNSLPPVKILQRYGDINNATNVLDFIIERKIDIPIDEVFQKCNTVQWGYNLTFTNRNSDCYINAVFSKENNVTLPLVVRNGYDVLNKIMFKKTISSTYAMTPAEEVYLFAEVVNDYYRYYPNLMTLFANYKEDAKRWQFEIGSMPSLEGKKIFNKFYNDPADPNRPVTYLSSVSVNSSTGLQIIDDETPFKLNYRGNSGYHANDLRPALDGSGGHQTFNHLAKVINAYNSTSDNKYLDLWSFGKYENGKWFFDLYTVQGNTWTPEATYEEAFGNMIPDRSAGKYDYEFQAGARGISVNNVKFPNSSSVTSISFRNTQSGTSYPNDMRALKEMLLGTYWEYYEEWKANNN